MVEKAMQWLIRKTFARKGFICRTIAYKAFACKINKFRIQCLESENPRGEGRGKSMRFNAPWTEKIFFGVDNAVQTC